MHNEASQKATQVNRKQITKRSRKIKVQIQNMEYRAYIDEIGSTITLRILHKFNDFVSKLVP